MVSYLESGLCLISLLESVLACCYCYGYCFKGGGEVCFYDLKFEDEKSIVFSGLACFLTGTSLTSSTSSGDSGRLFPDDENIMVLPLMTLSSSSRIVLL